MKPVLINDTTKMDQLLDDFLNEPILSIDTEFFRETTYYPHLGLIQIASNNIVACIDPLAFDSRPALQKIFLNPRIIKVFHSCSQDLEVLFHHFGFTPAPIHDTQIACALLGRHDQIGYASMVETELGVQLPKTQTRTNWIKRPLSTQQINYAGDDVYYLYQVYKILHKRLTDKGRLEWFEEDCRKLYPTHSSETVQSDISFSADTQTLWQRVKGSRKYHGKKLAIIQAIALWRENIAIETDTTRRRVLRDEKIIELSLHPPTNQADINYLLANRFSVSNEQQILLFKAIENALYQTPALWPENNHQILSDSQKEQLKTAQRLLNAKADALGISSTILCSRKEMEKLITTNRECAVLKGWRDQCIGKQLLKETGIS